MSDRILIAEYFRYNYEYVLISCKLLEEMVFPRTVRVVTKFVLIQLMIVNAFQCLKLPLEHYNAKENTSVNKSTNKRIRQASNNFTVTILASITVSIQHTVK